MRITYIEHSGFAAEYGDRAFIFDYYKGRLPPFDKGKALYVFASHGHFDHFTEDIFSLEKIYPRVTYILSDDIAAKRTGKNIIRMSSGQEREEDGLFVKTLRSTDEGVAFLIRADGRTLYHAGDLNWWHWEGESAVYQKFMERTYKHEISKLEGMEIDVAFVPLDPRLENQYFWGLDWFMRHTRTSYVFPMHMGGEYGLYDRLMSQAEAKDYRERVLPLREAGQVFELDFKRKEEDKICR